MENKKTYSKPQIVYESFELSANIAASCTLIVNASESTNCYPPYDLGDGTMVFTDATQGCEYISDPKKFCYHVPIYDGSTFAS